MKRKQVRPRGRPPIYRPDTRVYILARGKAKLQSDSVRRHIIDTMVERGGVMSIGQINEALGYDAQAHVVALIRAGWLEVMP